VPGLNVLRKVIVDVSLKTVSGERNPSWNRKSKESLSVVV